MSIAEAFAQDLIDNESREVIAGILGYERAVRMPTEQIEGMTDNGLVRVAQEAAAEIARLEAIQVRAAGILARRRRNPRSVEAEFALALCITKTYAGAFVSAAESLTTRLPKTLGLMERGKLNLFRAMKVTDATVWLSDDAARIADAALETRLPGKDATGVRKAANYAAAMADPEGSKRREGERRESRSLSLIHQDSGTATLSIDDAPVEKAVAAYSRVDRLAKSLKTRDETRTLDQLRADVALDLLLCAEKSGAPPRLEGFIYLDLDTYLGLNENPAEFAGHGPISAALARELLDGPDTVLRRIITDPITRPGARPRPHPLSPHRGNGRVRPGPRPHLPLPRLQPPRPSLRNRPHGGLATRRRNPHEVPGRLLHPRPPPEGRTRLALRPHRRRHPHHHHPGQPEVPHHPTHPPRPRIPEE